MLCTSVNAPEQKLYEIERLPIEQIKIEHKARNKTHCKRLRDLVRAMVWVESKGDPNCLQKEKTQLEFYRLDPLW